MYITTLLPKFLLFKKSEGDEASSWLGSEAMTDRSLEGEEDPAFAKVTMEQNDEEVNKRWQQEDVAGDAKKDRADPNPFRA